MSARYGVTGPRELTDEQERIVADSVLLALQADEYAAEFTSGCAYGADTVGVVAAERARIPLIRLTIPTGCRYNDALHRRLATRGSGVKVVWTPRLASELAAVIYLRRDDLTVAHLDVLLAFPKTSTEQRRGSGTWATIRRARGLGREIRFFPLDGSPEWVEAPTVRALPGV